MLLYARGNQNENLTPEGFHFARRKSESTSSQVIPVVVRFGGPGKEGAKRKKLILEILERRRGSSSAPNDYVFPIYEIGMGEDEKHRRKANHIRRIRQHFKKVEDALGLEYKGTSIGIARHSFASHMHNGNTPMVFLKEAMGHSNERVTSSYLRTLPGKEYEAFYKNLV